MKDPFRRTKVVLRHLPPSLSQDQLLSQIQHLVSGRYSCFSFSPGKTSQKRQKYSRAYIDFKNPEDVFEFTEFFNGHVFVNEKGSQFKVIVEYAPSQRIPKLSANKDGRGGTIYKDPEYLEFLKIIAKPAENLPRAEFKLEMRESEQSGSVAENPIVTPLMEFVRQKRAAENVSLHIRKLSKRAAASSSKLGSTATKSSSEKKKYILKGSSKKQSGKVKSSPIIVSRKGVQPASSTVQEIAEHEKGITSTNNSRKKKTLLLKSRDQEIPQATSQLLDGTSSRSSPAPGALRQRQRREVGRKLIKDILLSNEAYQCQALKADQQPKNSDSVNQTAGTYVQSDANFHSSHCEPSSLNSYDSRKDDKHIRKDFKGFVSLSEKHEKGPKNRGRPDRGIRALHHTINSQATQEHPSSSVSQYNELLCPAKVNQADMKNGAPLCRKMNVPSVGNGLQMHSSHHQMVKNNGSSIVGEGKFSRRRFPSGSVASEKRVWIQKSPAGS